MKASNTIPGTTASRNKAGQAAIVALLVLALGIFIGYLFHNSTATGVTAAPASQSPASASGSSVQPLLDQLKSNPNNPDLLVSIGNTYYDQRDYSQAVSYYRQYLRLRPKDVPVRTDMGTAIWYSGDADGAIQQYETALRYQPNYPNTLFNMGIVKWQGKQDRWGALDAWQKLLSTHPDYPDRQRVEQLMQKVRSGTGQAQSGSQ